MKYYLAPMEGLTGYIYRNAYHHHFMPMDKYFAPFIVATSNRKMNHREWNDLLPEHNQEINLIPQILSNKADDFLNTASRLWEMGYKEINLNLGCPSKTVVSKGKGSGFLDKTVELERFLDQVYSQLEGKLSIKTRVGRFESDEFEMLLSIFNRFPIEELIIHPRVQTDYYKNQPDMEAFRFGYENSKTKVCYNGDVFSVAKAEEIVTQFPDLDSIMLGRGIIRNPDLRNVLEEKKPVQKNQDQFQRWSSFHNEIFEEYEQTLDGDRPLLFKMKEIWHEWGFSFENQERLLKKIKKCNSKEEYKKIVNELFLLFFS